MGLILIPLRHWVKDFFLDPVRCGNFLISDLVEEVTSTGGPGSGGWCWSVAVSIPWVPDPEEMLGKGVLSLLLQTAAALMPAALPGGAASQVHHYLGWL